MSDQYQHGTILLLVYYVLQLFYTCLVFRCYALLRFTAFLLLVTTWSYFLTTFYYVVLSVYYILLLLYVLLHFHRKLENVHEGSRKFETVGEGWRK